MNLSMMQEQTHKHREQTIVAKRGGVDWEFSTSRCKLLCIGWRNNKLYSTVHTCIQLLWSTGHHFQYPVIDHNGKEKI